MKTFASEPKRNRCEAAAKASGGAGSKLRFPACSAPRDAVMMAARPLNVSLAMLTITPSSEWTTNLAKVFNRMSRPWAKLSASCAKPPTTTASPLRLWPLAKVLYLANSQVLAPKDPRSAPELCSVRTWICQRSSRAASPVTFLSSSTFSQTTSIETSPLRFEISCLMSLSSMRSSIRPKWSNASSTADCGSCMPLSYTRCLLLAPSKPGSPPTQRCEMLKYSSKRVTGKLSLPA
mmetsp:Transcript_68743/g.223837  ORF Transcript_68743/g.223837 Transcript_68743/m.223837 type:complete len:235 (-) Transcript_68743:505-1209(-)